MRIFKLPLFEKWTLKEGISDRVLSQSILEMEAGLIDANLGGHIYKKRISLAGRGKRGGARILIIYRKTEVAFFIYGYSKNNRDDIDVKELRILKELAEELLSYTPYLLNQAVDKGEFIEVHYDEKKFN